MAFNINVGFVGLILASVASASCTTAAWDMGDELETSSQALTAMHRIKSRSASPYAQFYDVTSSYTFHPVGNNYIQLAWYNGVAYHSTFRPGDYDAAAADAALSKMHYDGYNLVRVFIQHAPTPGGNTGGVGGLRSTNVATLDSQYMANVEDFLVKARTHRMYVTFVLDYYPSNTYYFNIAANCPTNIANSEAANYLCTGPINAKKTYVTEFVSEIKAYDANLLPSVFSYELQNEVAVTTNQVPFSLTSGTITTADGGTYDMAVASDRQQCFDANLVHYMIANKNAIQAVDPDAMVSASVFTFAAVGKSGPSGMLPIPAASSDQRWPARPSAMLQFAQVSYIDIHAYPLGSNYSLNNDLTSSEFFSMSKTSIPFHMGELGAFKAYYPDVSVAASAMKSHRDAAYGFGFQGSSLWMWNTNGQPEPWAATESGGVIENALSPNMRWTFNTDGNFEGWGGLTNWSGGTVSGGSLFGLTTSPDPYMVSAPISINADVSKFVKIKLANNSNATVSQIYWLRAGDTQWNEAKHADVRVTADNGAYLPYTFDLRANANWNGTIVQLRADPVNMGNNAWVGYNEILVTPQADTPYAN